MLSGKNTGCRLDDRSAGSNRSRTVCRADLFDLQGQVSRVQVSPLDVNCHRSCKHMQFHNIMFHLRCRSVPRLHICYEFPFKSSLPGNRGYTPLDDELAGPHLVSVPCRPLHTNRSTSITARVTGPGASTKAGSLLL